MEQVVTNSYQITLSHFIRAYLFHSSKRSDLLRYINIAAITVLVVGIILWLTGDTKGWGYYIISGVIPTYFEIEEMLMKLKIKRNAYSLGFNNNKTFAIITPDEIKIIDEEKETDQINKSDIEKIYFYDNDYLIFKQNKELTIIPGFAFLNKSAEKFVRQNYFVHYL